MTATTAEPECPATEAQRRFDRTVHVGFFLVLIAATLRYLAWRGYVAEALPVLTFAGLICVVYLAGAVAYRQPGRAQTIWVLTLVALWATLTVTTPAYTWCAVPLFFLVLRALPTPGAILLIVGLTLLAAIAEQAHHRQSWDPSLALAPVVIAVLGTVLYRQLHRENARRQSLIDDLVRTRNALATSEREAGVLSERVRLSREIHDTLAQGLSSMHLLLNAADREWSGSPDRARSHVQQAAAAARDNLAEARRFVRDLAPPALDDSSLTDAIRRLCADVPGLETEFRIEGDPSPLGLDVETALLRVAQGALANVAQHASARTAVVTLTYLPEAVSLDVADDGVGFDPAAPCPAADRGFGLRAIRQRIEALGGTATVESAPGDGTRLAVSLPLDVLEPVGGDR